jgi:hypothetical protein
MKDRMRCDERWLAGLVWACLLVAVSVSEAAELKQETLQSWDEYVQSVNSQMKGRVGTGGTFLWMDQTPDVSRQVRAGTIVVSPAAAHIPRRVPSGLIHDWIGVTFFPNTKLEDVLAVVRDYDRYKNFYKPYVVESKSLASSGEDDRFSMLLVNKEVVAKLALEGEYQACYQQFDATRWYGIAYSTRIQEIHDYGHPGEQKLPPGEGNGYIWRLYSIARFEERDGGVYMELEAMALSRDVPAAFRWVVDPIVRRISKSSLLTSLRQTQEAVRSMEATAGRVPSQPPASSSSDCLQLGTRSPARP